MGGEGRVVLRSLRPGVDGERTAPGSAGAVDAGGHPQPRRGAAVVWEWEEARVDRWAQPVGTRLCEAIVRSCGSALLTLSRPKTERVGFRRGSECLE